MKSSVVLAASRFKQNIRRSVVDPYAIQPEVDGRITNIAEAKIMDASDVEQS